MSAADLIRKAAASEREEWGDRETRRVFPKASNIHLALADWLDKEADFAECSDQLASPHATAVARLIVGDES